MEYNDLVIIELEKFSGETIGETADHIYLQIKFRLNAYEDGLVCAIEITPDEMRLYDGGVFTPISCYSDSEGAWDCDDVPREKYGLIYRNLIRAIKPLIKNDVDLRFRLL